MLKMQIVGEVGAEKPALNSINVPVVYDANFGSHGTQIFKGIAGLCGLSALGGLVYWASSWFGGNGADPDRTANAGNADSKFNTASFANTAKASVGVLAENEHPLVVNSLSSPATAFARADIVGKYSVSANNVGNIGDVGTENNIQKLNSDNVDAVFSTDDLIYRPKVYRSKTSEAVATFTAAASEQPNHQRKFLGNVGATPTPVLIHNQLSIGQGRAVSLTLEMLSVNTTNIDPTTISYLDSNVEHGRFEYVFNQGVHIGSFGHTEIVNNFVRFVHDNELVAPSYQIEAKVGALRSAPQNATIAFDFAPVLSGNSIVIGQGQEVFVSNTLLNATDVDTDPLTLQFIRSNMQHGQFKLATTGKAVSEFTQAQVINNQIKFVHDGSFIAPAYQISVDDGIVATEPFDAEITFYKAPTLSVKSLTVFQGETILVTNKTLHASSVGTAPSALTYIINNLLHGKFSLVSNPSVIINDFTEQQILTGVVQFTHDNTQVAPYCLVSVSNGFAVTTQAEMTVSFDIAPVLSANQLTIRQGETIVITNSMLSATDQDTDLEKLVFKITNLKHGQFEYATLPKQATLVFMQKDIMGSNITFTHDGSLLAPTYSVAVSDSLVTIDYQSALITFLPTTEAATSNTVRNAIISASIGGSFGLGLWIFKKYVNRRTAKEFAATDIQNQVCLAMLKRIKVSGFLDYMSDNVIQDLRKAVSALFKTLLAIGVKLNIENMTAIEQQKLVDEIVRQTEKVLKPENPCCHKVARFFKNYFVCEFTPEQIEREIKKIGRAVKAALAKANITGSELELTTQSTEEVFTRNPLSSISTESAAVASGGTNSSPSARTTSLDQKDTSIAVASTSAASIAKTDAVEGNVIMEVTDENIKAIREENMALLAKVSELELAIKDGNIATIRSSV